MSNPLDIISKAAEGLEALANTPIEKAESGQPEKKHAVKVLVRPKDGGKPFYRTYWVANYNDAYDRQTRAFYATEAMRNIPLKQQAVEHNPDSEYYKDDLARLEKHVEAHNVDLEALDADTGVERTDQHFPVVAGKSPLAEIDEQVAMLTAEKEAVRQQWIEYDKAGPAARKIALSQKYLDYLRGKGLNLGDAVAKEYDGVFRRTFYAPDGKEQLGEINLEMSYDWEGEKRQYIPSLEVNFRHNRFKTTDMADFANLQHVARAATVVSDIVNNKEELDQLLQIRRDFHDANKEASVNEFANQYNDYERQINTLEKSRKQLLVDDVVANVSDGSYYTVDSEFQLSDKRWAQRYHFFRVIKQTPKTVVVGFSNNAGGDKWNDTEKTFNKADFHSFVEQHVNLDAHKTNYTGATMPEASGSNEVKGVPVEAKEHKNTAKKLGVDAKKLGKMINDDHKKEVASKPAGSTGKKVVNHDTFDHPAGWKVTKGMAVKFEHGGEIKDGTVMATNVYQRFANPYVKMKGADGKVYEIVISKVSNGGADKKK